MRVRSLTGIAVVALAVSGCSGPQEPQIPAPLPASPVQESPSPAPRVSASVSPSVATPAKVRTPPVNAVFDYQIGGAYKPSSAVGVVSRDREDRPVAGLYNICYLNAFQTQPGENAWWKRNHDSLLLRIGGSYAEDPNWPGEIILDLSTADKRAAVAKVVAGWINGCRAKGFQAVEPDNLDSWTRSHGRLTQAHALAYAKLLTTAAHHNGLAIGQKNTPELGQAGKRAGFDFAIAEECAVYDECGDYIRMYGDHVIEIEYTDDGRGHYDKACAAHGKRLSVILRDRDVVAAGRSGYHFEHC